MCTERELKRIREDSFAAFVKGEVRASVHAVYSPNMRHMHAVPFQREGGRGVVGRGERGVITAFTKLLIQDSVVTWPPFAHLSASGRKSL